VAVNQEAVLANERLAIDGGEPLRREPFGPRWDFGEPEKRNLRETIDRASEPGGSWGTTNQVREFEDAFAKRHGVKYAIATDSGTGAIHAAVGAVNPEPGDEIITTPVTDIGTVLGILLQNAIPVFADWDPDRLNTDPADVERRITDRTRAIIAVHLFGNPCDMDAMMDVGRRHNIPVIEDCSHAHLAEYKGRLVGTIGDMGCYSMGGKLITAGGGGMFISNNEELTRRAIGFARKGSEYDEGLRNSLRPTSDFQGSKSGYSFLGDFHRMSPVMAAVGLAQLGRIEKTMYARGRTWEIVDEMTADIPGFVRPKIGPGDKTSYYVYAYRIVEQEMGAPLAEFAEALRAEGIDGGGPVLGGIPLYRYPIFAEGRTYGQSQYPFVDEQGNRRIDYASMHLPVIERLLASTSALGARSTDTEEDARDIGTAICKVARYFNGRN
jgi:perosamine synthetase